MTLRVGLDMVPAELSASGVGRYTRELREALARVDGVEVVTLGEAHGSPGGGVDRALRGLRREGWYYPRGLEREARAHGADLVHCPGGFLGVVRDRPQVVSIHDVLPLRHPELFPRVIVASQRLFLRRRAPRATRVIAVSDYSRDESVSLLGVDRDRVDVIPEGVDERFRPTPRDPAWLRERFGIESPFVLCVATLEPRKNLLGALRAFRSVAVGRSDLQLVVTGGSGWRNEGFERELALDPARVVTTGWVDDEELVRLYGSAAVFLFPSLAEGFGLPVLEAMACGAPVVSSDRPSLPEVVGDDGLMADPSDPAALAAAISRVLEDDALAASLRDRGLARAARFTWAETAARTVSAYRAALEDFRPA
jgi:glycosyltransferase involved in cell wall biosynthesis